MEWIRQIDGVSQLWAGTTAMARVYHEVSSDKWILTIFCINHEIYELGDCDDISVAEWRATNIIYNRCNEIVRPYFKIRDNLPNIHDLAEKAGINKYIDDNLLRKEKK